MHIPFVHMIKFKLLAQFSVDHLPYPVVSTFAHCVIDPFISITTLPTPVILLLLLSLLLLLYTLLEFFTSALTDGFTLEFE